MHPRLFPLAAVVAALTLPAHAEDSNQSVSSGSAFNPAISLILSGNFYNDSASGKLLAPAGINHVSPGIDDQGFNLGETELVLSATVDPDFDAAANIVLDGQGKAAVEEAWFETRQLPYGLKVRAGKMKSNIGYLNSQHPHTWDFADQNLAYNALLGGEGITDSGLRVEWLPDWSLYTLLGIEALQGKQEVVGVSQVALDAGSALNAPAEKNGPRLVTAYIKVSPDLGDNHTLQLGLWGLGVHQQQEAYGTAGADEYLLDGNENIHGLEVVYKYDGGGEAGHRNLKIQSEILHGQKNLTVAALGGTPLYNAGNSVNAGDRVDSSETAYYVQAVYGIAPRWQLGLRLDQSGLGSRITEAGRGSNFDASRRASMALTWNITEFSRLRAQYSKADVTNTAGQDQPYDQYFLTYSMSLGTHGAHKF
ncbi:MAG: TonB-dependent receptor [bacterium]|nr:TonB-dependent receptor [bacterium]